MDTKGSYEFRDKHKFSENDLMQSARQGTNPETTTGYSSSGDEEGGADDGLEDGLYVDVDAENSEIAKADFPAIPPPELHVQAPTGVMKVGTRPGLSELHLRADTFEKACYLKHAMNCFANYKVQKCSANELHTKVTWTNNNNRTHCMCYNPETIVWVTLAKGEPPTEYTIKALFEQLGDNNCKKLGLKHHSALRSIHEPESHNMYSGHSESSDAESSDAESNDAESSDAESSEIGEQFDSQGGLKQEKAGSEQSSEDDVLDDEFSVDGEEEGEMEEEYATDTCLQDITLNLAREFLNGKNMSATEEDTGGFESDDGYGLFDGVIYEGNQSECDEHKYYHTNVCMICDKHIDYARMLTCRGFYREEGRYVRCKNACHPACTKDNLAYTQFLFNCPECDVEERGGNGVSNEGWRALCAQYDSENAGNVCTQNVFAGDITCSAHARVEWRKNLALKDSAFNNALRQQRVDARAVYFKNTRLGAKGDKTFADILGLGMDSEETKVLANDLYMHNIGADKETPVVKLRKKPAL